MTIRLDQAQGLLKTAGSTIRTQAAYIEELEAKLAAQKRTDRIVKIASTMEEKGLNGELSYEEKLASLRERADLDVTEEAVKMAAPQGVILGGPSDSPGAGGEHPFLTFMRSGETD